MMQGPGGRLTAIVVLCAGLALATPARPALSDGMSKADTQAIHKVISSQIAAFRRDDAAAAYSLAAPEIHMLFPDADVFLNMVRTTYPPVYRPQIFYFGTLTSKDGNILQQVQIVGPQGKPWTVIYRLTKQENGDWRIASVIMASGKGTAT